MAVLTGIDVIGVQKYIFASNRLRDTLSGSWMLTHVTCRESLAQWGLPLERVLLDAGGNAIVEFADEADARKWTGSYTRWLLETAPGLELVVGHQPYSRFAQGLQRLLIQLAHRKTCRIPNVRLLGFGVTAPCALTGLPATDVDQGELVSRDVKRRRDEVENAKQTWSQYLPTSFVNTPDCQTQFPDELDKLGRTRSETSLIGVIHVDGNSVGKLIQRWLERCADEDTPDSAVRQQFFDWSLAIKELGQRGLKNLVERVAACIYKEDNQCWVRGTPHELGFSLADTAGTNEKSSGREIFLPVRPILLGGDDITLVCDGRIALDLAAASVAEFQRSAIPHLGDEGQAITLSSCAGVAIVNSHAPFHRAYDLAEALCRSAKRARQKMNETDGGESGGWIDWHIGMTRPGESIEDVRSRHYKNLTMRPYPFADSRSRPYSWPWFENSVLGPGPLSNHSLRGFRSETDVEGQERVVMNEWSGSRNRVKQLNTLLYEGKDTVARQIQAWQVTDSDLRMPEKLDVDGFIGGRTTPLLDAIELLDLHIRLEPDPIISREPARTIRSETNKAPR